MKIRDVTKLVQADGWIVARTRGSHRQYKHPSKPGLVTIAGKPSDDLARELPTERQTPCGHHGTPGENEGDGGGWVRLKVPTESKVGQFQSAVDNHLAA